MRRIAFVPAAFDDFSNWATAEKKVYGRLVKLIKDIEREGIGKPEPLKHSMAGLWSRRITDEHRLVYRVTDDEIVIVSCKYHYK